jgi:hypothetical protein
VAGLGFVVELTFLNGRAPSWPAARSSRCSSTTNERGSPPPARAARAGQDQPGSARARQRPDGYHELRTIFQTISLADSIEIAFTPARRTTIELADDLHLPITWWRARPALAMDAMRAPGAWRCGCSKRIPMGAGLGGGSSDAAAVLLALPVLAGRSLAMDRLCQLARNWAATCRSFCWAARRWASAAARNCFRCPMAARRGVLVAPGFTFRRPKRTAR